MHESQEKQKTTDHHSRMVKSQDCPCQKHDMNQHDSRWHMGASVAVSDLHLGMDVFPGLQLRKLLTEIPCIKHRADYNSDCRHPSKMDHHECHIPTPLSSNHENRRSGEVSQRAAYGHIHKEQANRTILQFWTGFQRIEMANQKKRSQGHCGRLCDERTQQWSNDQNRDPPRLHRSPSK
ncbi:MAG: hypothetical protein BWY82_01131 [Verrucomicrobia bacterium ADurb.Bin474]|nr:MAG: hypothetical protein BWY82_01131 [Verrucomicrobia bacterium ADurb.Bin474]